MMALRIELVLCLALLASAPLAAQTAELGRLDFPNSGAAAAQEPFLRGVLLLHSFEFEDAHEAFQEARKADPDFALAYWGEAMTYNHPLWREQDRDAALQALERLAPTPAARLARAPTERDKEDALRQLEEAAAAEDALPIEYGPPDVVKPTHELLCELLLQLGRAREAQGQFELALKRAPRRSPSLLGLARAANQAGDLETAEKAYAELRRNWQKADAGLAELEKANVKAGRTGSN